MNGIALTSHTDKASLFTNAIKYLKMKEHKSNKYAMRIGIITMHRVPNFGSALQAYALQKKLFLEGFDNMIIDYLYSYSDYEPNFFEYLFDKIRVMGKVILNHPPCFSRFYYFRKKYIRTTLKEYTKKELSTGHPPKFDIYMTGSDQVWNCRFTKGDSNFLLKFAPKNAPRLAFGSSFASTQLQEVYKPLYKEELAKYKCIFVREKSGIDIVTDLIGESFLGDIDVVCDPTILLEAKDYAPLATKSKIKIEGKYILVYVLDYMFNPYPHIFNIVRKVKDTLGYKVIYIGKNYLDESDSSAVFVGNDAGPLEFLNLVEHAAFIITTSFHGTAFATIFGIPLLAIVSHDTTNDDRIQTLLHSLGQERSITYYDSDVETECITSEEIITKAKNLNEYREKSAVRLIESIKSAYPVLEK